jgi:hypothetical protein
MTGPGPDRRSGRRKLVLLAAIFLLPLAAAMWLNFSSWRPASGTQHGELIDPPRPLPEVVLMLPDGRATSPKLLRGAWFLVYLGDGPCAEQCAATLAEMRRVRLALDKDAARVRRVLLHTGDCCGPDFHALRDQDLLVLAASGHEGRTLLELFPRAPDRDASIYIVDPLGNLMMRHPATGAASGLLKDLERLLRLSSIG